MRIPAEASQKPGVLSAARSEPNLAAFLGAPIPTSARVSTVTSTRWMANGALIPPIPPIAGPAMAPSP